MGDLGGNASPQTLNAIAAVQNAAFSPDIVRRSGAGKAYQAVAQSTAIAVQDAADNLRNVMTISTTAIGVALAQLLATGDTQYAQAIDEANTVIANAADQFKKVGENAAAILNSFPCK